jgi:hypothetical protein
MFATFIYYIIIYPYNIYYIHFTQWTKCAHSTLF